MLVLADRLACKAVEAKGRGGANAEELSLLVTIRRARGCAGEALTLVREVLAFCPPPARCGDAVPRRMQRTQLVDLEASLLLEVQPDGAQALDALELSVRAAPDDWARCSGLARLAAQRGEHERCERTLKALAQPRLRGPFASASPDGHFAIEHFSLRVLLESGGDECRGGDFFERVLEKSHGLCSIF